MKKKVYIMGPDIKNEGKVVGGQLTHLVFLRDAFKFSDFDTFFIATSSGFGNESSFRKLMVWIRAIFSIMFSVPKGSCFHVNSAFNKFAIIRDFVLCLFILMRSGRFIIQYHGGTGNSYTSWSLAAVFKLMARPVFQRSSGIYFLTTQQKKVFESCFGVDCELIDNYYPVDKSVQGISSSADTSKPLDKLDILFMGRLEADKGLLDLIGWYATSAYRDRIVINIAGDGSLRAMVESHAQESKVVYHGIVSGPEKIALLAKSHFLILPSYAEAFPYSLLEAFAVATPAISTNVGAVSRLVDHGVNGYLLSGVKFDDFEQLFTQIFSLAASDEEYMSKLRVAAGLKFNGFNANAMNKKFTQIWQVMYA